MQINFRNGSSITNIDAECKRGNRGNNPIALKKISRYWVHKEKGLFYRRWTDKEYIHHNPEDKLIEKVWCTRCCNCGSLDMILVSKDDAIRRIQKYGGFCMPCLLSHQTKKKYKPYSFEPQQFTCVEVGDKPVGNMAISYHKFYD